MQIYSTGLRLSAWNTASFPFCNPVLRNNVKTTKCVTHMSLALLFRLTGPTSALQITKRCWEKFHKQGKYSWPLSNMEINLHIIHCQPFCILQFFHVCKFNQWQIVQYCSGFTIEKYFVYSRSTISKTQAVQGSAVVNCGCNIKSVTAKALKLPKSRLIRGCSKSWNLTL